METLTIKGRPPRVYTIVRGGINITTFTNPKLPTEEHIPFESIKSDRFFHVEKSSFLLIGAGISGMIYLVVLADSLKHNTNLYIINLTWAVLAVALLALYFFWRPKAFFVKTFTGRLIKFKVSKNENEVADFVQKLIENRNNYLKFRYGTPNSQLSYDSQYSNLNILFREGILTPAEYQEKIEILNTTFEQTLPKQIFQNYSQN